MDRGAEETDLSGLGGSLTLAVDARQKKGPAPSDRGLIRIALSRIAPDEKQPRRYFAEADLISLAEDIERQSMIQPITVRPSQNEKDRYIIIVGERRYQAVKRLGWTHVECQVVMISDAYAIKCMQTAENRQRQSLTLEEEARSIKDALSLADERGISAEQVARDLGYELTAMRRLAAINKVPDPVMALVREGRTKDPELVVTLGHIFDHAAPLYEKMVKDKLADLRKARDVWALLSGGESPDEVAAMLDAGEVSEAAAKRRSEKKAAQAADKKRKALAAGKPPGATPPAAGPDDENGLPDLNLVHADPHETKGGERPTSAAPAAPREAKPHAIKVPSPKVNAAMQDDDDDDQAGDSEQANELSPAAPSCDLDLHPVIALRVQTPFGPGRLCLLDSATVGGECAVVLDDGTRKVISMATSTVTLMAIERGIQ